MERFENVIQISAGTIIKTVLILLLFWTIFFLKNLVLIILLSIVIASAVEPAAQWLMRRKVPRLLSVILVYLSLAVALICVVYFLVLPLLSESGDFLKNLPTYFNVDTVSNTIDQSKFLSSQPIVSGLQNSINLGQIVDKINGAVAGLSSSAFNTVSSVFGGILSFFLMVVMSFYLSVERDGVGKFLKIITPLKHENYIIDLWKRSQRKIGLWMQGQIILAVTIGVLVYLGLMLLNVPNALLLACLAGAFEIIPLFGPILASIPAIAISFVSGGFTAAILTVAFYLIIHQFENQLIYPLVVKKVVGVPPIVSIVALVAGFELAGFLGLILSVPIAAIFIEFFDDLERDKIEKIERMKTQS
jgi:predicted PurR-regulated permease PerM